MLNVMSEPIIRVELANNRFETLTLPDTYAHLVENDLKSFQALRTHQRHGVHAFLVQLAVLALRQTGQTELPDNPEDWRRTLRSLTQRRHPQDAPWQLVNPRWDQPALLQTPVMPNEQSLYKRALETPDTLDQLIAADNHKMKQHEGYAAQYDDWLFALINLQTMQGALGRNNYGISRMNGGASSRPVFTLAPLGRPGDAIARDINALLHHEPKADPAGRTTLVWLLPWQGLKADQLQVDDLSDLYIEICRRLRLQSTGPEQLTAYQAGTDTTRIDKIQPQRAETDPWTPFNVKEQKTLSIVDPAFTYQQVAAYLTNENWQWPRLLHLTAADLASDQTLAIHAAGLARGNGKTFGYFERTIELDPSTIQAMAEADRERLNAVTQTHLQDARTTLNILYHAILTYLAPNRTSQSGEKAPPQHTSSARIWGKPMDQKIDSVFFQYLQQEIAAPDEAQAQADRAEWQLWLYNQAKIALQEAQENLPQSVNAARSATRSNSIFESRVRGKNGLTLAFPPKETQEADQPEDQPDQAEAQEDQQQPQEQPAAAAPAPALDQSAPALGIVVVRPKPEPEDEQQPLPDTAPTRPVHDQNQTYAQRMANKAVAIASQLSGWNYSQGDLAELRRMNLDNLTTPAFHRLLVNNEINLSPQNQQKWAMIVKGIAVMTHNGTGKPHEPLRINPHQPYISVGQAMHNGAPGNHRLPFLHPNRFQMLMNAQRQNLTAKLTTFFQMARSERLKLNWRQMATFILAQEQEPKTARALRLRITEDYYRAEYDHQRPEAPAQNQQQEEAAV